ncbi:hypothetical protein COLO4_11804 [Corchorus olitorius]|uniref:Uncharacterized protein n=1 Tax=Corchorus olitorius TaxID=93759 RepID=A0A1R3K388_9ROSI|nr:hypothetical protein COLO4_11804 [Corchorus olitorius]
MESKLNEAKKERGQKRQDQKPRTERATDE